jgi:hypothetical protein
MGPKAHKSLDRTPKVIQQRENPELLYEINRCLAGHGCRQTTTFERGGRNFFVVFALLTLVGGPHVSTHWS